MRKRTQGLFGLVLLWGFPLHAGDVPLIADFARHPDFNRVKLSPQGDYLAVTVSESDQTNLAVMRLSDRKVTGGLLSGSGRHVHDFWWVGPERVVASFAERQGALDQPVLTRELVGVDVDGRRNQYLFGYRGPESVGSRLQRGTLEYAHARMVDPLPEQPGVAIIAVDAFRGLRQLAQTTKAYRLDVYNGRVRPVAQAPLTGWSYFVTDTAGDIRYAVGDNPKTLHRESYVVDQSAVGGWRRMGTDDNRHARQPLQISVDGSIVYSAITGAGGRRCLEQQHLSTGSTRVLSCDEVMDLADVVLSADGRTPIAAVYRSLQPRVHWLDPEHPDAKLLSALQQSFPDELLSEFSWSSDGQRLSFRVDSDRNPGTYHLLDRKTLQASFLLAVREPLQSVRMGARRPFRYRSRDGTATLFGQLTLPPQTDVAFQGGGGALPAVVLIHGGPFGVFDDWLWQADAQFLATRGYAVIQPNFRGSGGYGIPYQESARKRWSSMMIDDINDAVQAVVQQGIVDPGRVCVMGGSYGGYAALTAALREPDRYRCVIAEAGVYDLAALKKSSDISESELGRNYVRMYIGGSDAELRAQSPLSRLEALKAPILVIHGRRDERAPFSQAEALRAGLERLGKPYEWLERPHEGHGFVDVENRIARYEQLLGFVQRNLLSPAKRP